MINVYDTSEKIYSAYDNGEFVIEKWIKYIDREVPGARELCLADMKEMITPDCSWDNSFLPIMNGIAISMILPTASSGNFLQRELPWYLSRKL